VFSVISSGDTVIRVRRLFVLPATAAPLQTSLLFLRGLVGCQHGAAKREQHLPDLDDFIGQFAPFVYARS
jgi:hypothetical protein